MLARSPSLTKTQMAAVDSAARTPGLRERKKHKARSDILEAAGKLIERSGYDATTMREIADAANVSYQTLYNYFQNKAQIVQGLLSLGRERYTPRLNRLLADPGLDLLQQLDGAIKLAFELVAQHDRPLWREVTALGFRQSNEFFTLFSSYYDNAQARLEQMFDGARRQGRLNAHVDIVVLAQTVYAIVDFGVLLYIADPTMTKATILRRLRAQLRLVLAPHLRESSSVS